MPRVFAPVPFRYGVIDYPYGWQDIADDSLAQTLKGAGYVVDGVFDDPSDIIKRLGLLRLDTSTALLTGPNGATFAAAPALASAARVMLLGDSWEARGNGTGVITAASRSNNVVTCTWTGHGLATGMIVTTGNFADSTFAGINVTMTRIDANNISYVAPGPDGSTTNLDGLSNGSTKKPMTGLSRATMADYGYISKLKSVSKGVIDVVHNGGMPGQTAADGLQRFYSEATKIAGLRGVILHFGQNDFANAGRSADQTLADIAAICLQARLLGLWVAVLGVGPWISGGTNTSRLEALRFNRLARAYAASTPNVDFVDIGADLVDPLNATINYPKANMILAGSDNFHPAPKGCSLIAKRTWARISYKFGPLPIYVQSQHDNYNANNLSRQIMDNAPWTATGGTVNAPATGTAPAGYSVSANNQSGTGTFSCSSAARADGLGYDLTFSAQAGGGSDTMTINYQSNVSATRFSPGDKLRVIFELTLAGTNGANLKGYLAGLYFQGGTVNPSINIISPTATSAADFGAVDETLPIISEDITVPADGSTGFGFQFILLFSAGGTALTGKFGVHSIEKQ